MRFLFALVAIIFAFTTEAQDTTRHYFDSGQLSCIEIKYPFESQSTKGYREELVKVFNMEGSIVFRGFRRNYAGSASIILKFHPNGAVKQIRHSSQPDGGIQYYKALYKLDTNGVIIDKQIDRRESLFDTPGKALDLKLPPNFKPNCPAGQEATLMITQIGIVNKTGKKQRVKLFPSESGSRTEILLQDGDTLNSRKLYTAEAFAPISKSFQIELAPKSKKKSFREIKLNSIPQLKVKDKDQELYILYFLIE